MSKIWLISDTHFGHANILNFKGEDGIPFRGKDFNTCTEMDEFMVHNWTQRIAPEDKVYHLGDVMFGDKDRFNALWARLPGQKRLLLGNHDDGHFLAGINPVDGKKYFEKIMVWRYFGEYDMILTHVPMQLENTYEGEHKAYWNVHGHIHNNPPATKRHINISVEQTGYAPVDIEVLAKELRVRKRQFTNG